MAENQPSSSSCVICKKEFNGTNVPVTVTDKGIRTLIRYSAEQGFLELKAYLTTCMNETPPVQVLVHKGCRRDFTDPKRMSCRDELEADQIRPPTKRLRSSEPAFDWKTNCLICGHPATLDRKHPDRSSKVSKVATLPIRDKLLDFCSKRGDTWASQVETRLHGCIDLVAAEAIYHTICYSRFLLNKSLVNTGIVGNGIVGYSQSEMGQEWDISRHSKPTCDLRSS